MVCFSFVKNKVSHDYAPIRAYLSRDITRRIGRGLVVVSAEGLATRVGRFFVNCSAAGSGVKGAHATLDVLFAVVEGLGELDFDVQIRLGYQRDCIRGLDLEHVEQMCLAIVHELDRVAERECRVVWQREFEARRRN